MSRHLGKIVFSIYSNITFNMWPMGIKIVPEHILCACSDIVADGSKFHRYANAIHVSDMKKVQSQYAIKLKWEALIKNMLPASRAYFGMLRCSGFSNLCVKSVQIPSFFCSVFSLIQSEYGKIRTRKSSIFGHFLRSEWLVSFLNSHYFLQFFYP